MVSPRENVGIQANAAARVFVRSLNILLKYSRLYGEQHARTSAQFEQTWKELSEAVAFTGVTVGIADEQLLADGVPLGAGTAERSLAKLLNTAGIASLYFSPATSPENFRDLVHALVHSGKSADSFEAAWKDQQNTAIRVNHVRFVAQSGEGEALSLAAQLATQALAEQAPELQVWLRDPHKLLQMIAAAEGAGHVTGTFPAPGATPGPDASQPTAPSVQEADLQQVIQMLSVWGKERTGPAEWQISGDVGALAAPAKQTLRQALQEIAAQGNLDADRPLLLQVAEHLAIRFAMEQFERGEVRVNAVREMLGRLSRELETLRSVLSAHEDKMNRAGLTVESHAEILDRQFWAAMPEKGKRSVLLSPDAWCIPPRNVEHYVRELVGQGDTELAENILANYAVCVRSSEAEGRSKAAQGLSHLAALYAGFPRLLQQALQHLGEQLATESDPELQRALSSAFVHMSNQAVAQKQYSSVQQALAAVDGLEAKFPELAQQLRPRLGLHDRLPQFVAEAISSDQPSPELLEMLRCVPKAAGEKLLRHFADCSRRESCERIISVMQQLGPGAVEHLRHQLQHEEPANACLSIGFLSRLDPRSLEHTLPQRLQAWPRAVQDMAVRQLGTAAAPTRGHLLLKLLDYADTALLPEMLDEIGMSEERAASSRLMTLAFDEAAGENAAFLRVKAIEALGRLRESKAQEHLRVLVGARQLLHWKHPREIRIAAAQALAMIDPQAAHGFLANKGFTPRELALGPLLPLSKAPWVRQRRYPRVLPLQDVSGIVATPKRALRLQVNRLSLGGGSAHAEGTAPATAPADIDLQTGLNHIRAQVWLRADAVKPHNVSFEIIRMDLDERSKLRRLLTGDIWSLPSLLHVQVPSSFRAVLS